MIKINLLAADKPSKKGGGGGGGGGVRTPSAPGAVQLYLFLILFVGGSLAVCAGMYFLILNEISRLETEITAAKKREQELQAIKKKVEEFQAKKKMYEEKVALIERLRSEQSGPVHMLDEISEAVPDFLWLLNMDQKGPSVLLKGESTGMPSVADFIANLQRSGWFPVAEPKTNVVNSATGVVTFEIGATFMDPAVAAKQKAAAEAAAKAAAAAPPARPAPGGRR
jgi:type IV pilus assembly protein PilN